MGLGRRISGVNAIHVPARVGTTAALPACTATIQTLTANANGVIPAQDGITLVANDRILVKNQVAAENNGIYVVSSIGSLGTPWVLTRAADCNSSTNIIAGTIVVIEEGATLEDTMWELSTDNPIIVGTTPLNFAYIGGISTLSGTGTLDYFAVFTGASTIGNGNWKQSGTSLIPVTTGSVIGSPTNNIGGAYTTGWCLFEGTPAAGLTAWVFKYQSSANWFFSVEPDSHACTISDTGNWTTSLNISNTNVGTSAKARVLLSGDSGSNLQFIVNSSGLTPGNVFNTPGAGNLMKSGGQALVIGTVVSGDLIFATSTLQRCVVTSDGKFGVGTGSPDTSSLVDISSTSKGFLFPRMTNAQMLAIATPATGLHVFNTTYNYLYVFDGSNWVVSSIRSHENFFFTATSPADSTSYHFGRVVLALNTTAGNRQFKFSRAGIITDINFNTYIATAVGSSEAATLYLRNITTATDTSIGTFTLDQASAYTNIYSALSVSVNTSDDYVWKVVTPAYVTNPTGVSGALIAFVK